MRKQELIHLHALCVLVRGQVEVRDDVPVDAFAPYEDLDVSPSAIYRSKSAHRRAVQTLASSLAGGLSDDATSAATNPVADGGRDRDYRDGQ